MTLSPKDGVIFFMSQLKEVAREYDKASPGAKKIIEDQVKHDQGIEISADRRKWCSMIFGFILSLGALVVAGYGFSLKNTGVTAAAGSIIGAGFWGAVSNLFAIYKESKQKEQE